MRAVHDGVNKPGKACEDRVHKTRGMSTEIILLAQKSSRYKLYLLNSLAPTFYLPPFQELTQQAANESFATARIRLGLHVQIRDFSGELSYT